MYERACVCVYISVTCFTAEKKCDKSYRNSYSKGNSNTFIILCATVATDAATDVIEANNVSNDVINDDVIMLVFP